MLIWGNFDTINTTARHGMALLNTDGSLDAFNLGGVANLYSVAGRGSCSRTATFASTLQGTYQNNLNATIARFNADGTVDSGFAIDPQAVGSSFAALPDGHILASNTGAGSLLNGGGGLFFKRLTSSGAIDNTFTGLGSTAFGAVYRDGSNRDADCRASSTSSAIMMTAGPSPLRRCRTAPTRRTPLRSTSPCSGSMWTGRSTPVSRRPQSRGARRPDLPRPWLIRRT